MEETSSEKLPEEEQPEKVLGEAATHEEDPSQGEGEETAGNQEASTVKEGTSESMDTTENLDPLELVETSETSEVTNTSEVGKTAEAVDPPSETPESENVENQEKEISLDKSNEIAEMNEDDSDERNLLLGDVEVTHTEVDLTGDLETQRLNGMCRVCAKSKVKLYPVFGTARNIMEKIHSFLPILVTPEDLLPVKICGRCLSSLDQSQRLVEICLAADKKLRSLLETKLTLGVDVQVKTEREDVDDSYDDYSNACDDDELDRPPTPFTPTSTDNNSMGALSPKREVITPEPSLSSKGKPKSASENLARRSELELLGDALSNNDQPQRKRRSRQETPESVSPTILEKMRSYGIKESSVVMTKVDIPEDSNSAVVTTVSVPITKEKSKTRGGPKRLYRCLYCSETGSDAYKLLLHQMKMHPGNLLKCPHCGFVCGSDQKAKFDAHVLGHTLPGRSQPKRVPELVALGNEATSARPERLLLPRPRPGVMLLPAPIEARKGSAQAGRSLKPSPKKRGKGPAQVATPIVTQIPGNAIMLRIQVDGQPGADKSSPAPTAIVPVTLYQCARCRLNFNTKEAVEKHICVLPSNLIPVALKPGENIPIPLKPGGPLPIALKPGGPIPIALKPGGPVPIALKATGPISLLKPVTLKPKDKIPISRKPGDPVPIASKPGDPLPIAPKPGEPIPVPIAPKPGDLEFTCTTCGIHFADAALLREHVITHYQTYKCDHCDAAFRSEFQLRQHTKKHSNEKREYPCPHCPKVYTVKSRLKVHLHSHSNTPRCVCPQCGKVFRTDGGYRNHIKAHENKRAFACSVCGFRFNRRSNMLRHEKNCDGKKSLTCRFCSETFVQKEDLLIHRSSVHPELEFSGPAPAEAASSGDKELKYACKVCSQGFRRVMELRRHQMIHSEEELNAVKNVPDGGAYMCHTCGKQLHHLHNYKLHMMHHQGKALFRCDQCDKPFTSKFALKYHHMLHTGDFPFKCSLCSESFRTSVALQVHRYKQHTGDKPYRCKSCEMGFFTRHSLRLHQIVHSNERNYVCRVCGSTFKRRKTLRYHSLIHTGEKPHTCRICGKSFRQKGTCTIHERNHDMATRKSKPNSGTGRRPRQRRQQESDTSDEDEEVEHVVLEGAVEEETEDDRAAQMMEMEVEDHSGTVGPGPQAQQRVWRVADPKAHYRLRNLDWRQPTTSQVNEGTYVLRPTEGMREGLPEVCAAQSEMISGEFLSMYPEMQMQHSEMGGEKSSIEFTTADGTIRILR